MESGALLVDSLICLAHIPPKKRVELTFRSVTPFAKRRTKGAPLLRAAHAGYQVAWIASRLTQ